MGWNIDNGVCEREGTRDGRRDGFCGGKRLVLCREGRDRLKGAPGRVPNIDNDVCSSSGSSVELRRPGGEQSEISKIDIFSWAHGSTGMGRGLPSNVKEGIGGIGEERPGIKPSV